MPAQRTSIVLKLLNGSAERNRARARDESKTTPRGRLDSLPDHIKLTPDEKKVFDWYVANGALDTVHRPTDAALLAAVARVTVELEAAHAKNVEYGPVMRAPKNGMPRESPFAHRERKLTMDLRGLLNELGMTPAGRLRIAPPFDGTPQRDAASWDEIDLR